MNDNDKSTMSAKPRIVSVMQFVLIIYIISYLSEVVNEIELSLASGTLVHPMVLVVAIPIMLLCALTVIAWEIKWKWSENATFAVLVLVFIAYAYVNHLRAEDLYLPRAEINNRSELVGAAIIEVIRHIINISLVIILSLSKKSKKYILSKQS